MTLCVKDFTSMLFMSLDKSFSLSQIISNVNIFYDVALEQICDVFLLKRMRSKELLEF